MNTITHSSFERTDVLEEDAALRSICDGTAATPGRQFLPVLISGLIDTLHAHGAWVAEYSAEREMLCTLAFHAGGAWRDNFSYAIAGTPCEQAIRLGGPVHFAENIRGFYPGDSEFMSDAGAVSYVGAPLHDVDGATLGLLAVMDTRRMPAASRIETIFRIFAARAAAELQRLRAEAQIRQGEQRLANLINGAIDAVIELDTGLTVTAVNPAGQRILRCAASELIDRHVRQILSSDGVEKLQRFVAELGRRPVGERYASIPGGLEAIRAGGAAFAAEATLAGYEHRGGISCTLLLREIDAYRNRMITAPLFVNEPIQDAARIYTVQELQEIERNNIVRALESTGWRVSGDDGAAQLLGMNSSTLSSRIKTLGIDRREQP
ncbi:MAG: sigma-54 dependent transcription regulator [Gammaproteobacteria bacterium]|nr:MAG: sigma-54 dependent transcription regulator [Gammaproteobacteria bacterium]TND00884.1 MAG: sigma-54 dependent transcription regulator [Gammaproteobacteria bacterium]